jgi:methyltransferase-like protein
MEGLSEGSSAAAKAYDAILYTGYPRAEMHPAVIAAVAKRYSFDAVPVHNCRVLEIGCGDGGHLLPLAVTLPESRFTGIDLSSAAIAKARETAAALNLNNIDCQVRDLMDVDENFGSFDYIIAHGFYSWVPPAVREKLLSVCARNLSARGLACISYNTLPGCHIRLMIREMLLFHTQTIDEPQKKIDQARAFLRFLAAANPEGTPYRKTIDDVLSSRDAALFHDDMAAVNDPLYFHQFYKHAAEYGLQYVGDSDWIESRDRAFPEEIQKHLSALESSDFLMKGQYLDFLKARRFRRSILCHANVDLDRSLHPSSLENLYVAGTCFRTGAENQFRSREGETITLSHPIMTAGMDILCARDDRPVLLRELIGAACDRSGAHYDDPSLITEMFLYLCAAHFVSFHTHCPPIADEPGERPLANPLARLQASQGTQVTNLMHFTVELKQTLPWCILPLADGTRDRAALKRDLAARFRERGTTLAREGQPYGNPEHLVDRLDAELEGALNALRRHALLLQAGS